MFPRVPSSSGVMGLSGLIRFLRQLEEADGAIIFDLTNVKLPKVSHPARVTHDLQAESDVLSPGLDASLESLI